MYSSSRCKNRTGRHTTPSHVSQYKAKNGNLRKCGSIFHHGTVYAPRQCSYHKEATGMESPKMHSSSRRKTALTSAGCQSTLSYASQYRAVNENLRKSVSTCCHGTVFPPTKCSYEKEDLLPWYRVSTNEMFI